MNLYIESPSVGFSARDLYKCPRCLRPMEVGDFPFCPHGSGVTRMHGDECDYWDHNLAQNPIHIRSWSQRRAIMAANGLQDFQYDVPVPEDATPNSQRPSRWGAYRLCSPDHLQWLASKLATGKPAKEDDDSHVRSEIYQGKGRASKIRWEMRKRERADKERYGR